MNILKMEKRYYVFNEKTFSRLLSLLRTMTTYTMEEPEKRNFVDYYYDNKENMLERNGLFLRRRIYGKKAQLKIKRRHFQPEFYYSDNLRSSEREMEINANDPLSKNYFFLNNAINSMFTSTLQFDTDKMFEKMHTIMIIRIKQERRFLFGYGGLKVEISHDFLNAENLTTNRKNNTEMVQFKLVSPENTLSLFEDLITRVEKHCKELFYTQDSKYEAVFKITRPLLSKEEKLKVKEELLKKKQLQEAGEQYVEKKEKK
ncbi:MAG: hypothetical protein EOM55_00890 [Clostridia bacterium]|nr:hypothetical protein [Clostridia bacterium]